MTDIWTPSWSSSSAIVLAAVCASASLAEAFSRASLALRMSLTAFSKSRLVQPSGSLGPRVPPFVGAAVCSGAGLRLGVDLAAGLRVLRVGVCLAAGLRLGALLGADLRAGAEPESLIAGTGASLIWVVGAVDGCCGKRV